MLQVGRGVLLRRLVTADQQQQQGGQQGQRQPGQPVLDEAGTVRLVVVPDGILFTLPFETLLASERGSFLAENHEVTVLDVRSDSFRRLPAEFRGRKHVGNGIDQDTLAKVGLGEADAFIAVTQGDNRNVMATQIAKHIFGVKRTLCRIYDPIRERMYHDIGLETISPTLLGAEMLKQTLDNPPATEKAQA